MTAVAVSREVRIKRIHEAFIRLMWLATRQFSQKLQHFGLTLPQFVALASLAAHKQTCTMSDLTRVTFQDPPTLTGVIDRLVKMELVERSRSESDRRVVLVQASPAGIQLVRRVVEDTRDDDITGCTSLADEDLAAFERLLEYIFRMHMQQRHASGDADWNAEIEKLRLFLRDPVPDPPLEIEGKAQLNKLDSRKD